MTSTTITLSRLDLASAGGFVRAIQANPSRPNATWRASVGWDGGFRASTVVRRFDPRPEHEAAPSPTSQVLSFLRECISIGHAANSSVAGRSINELRLDLEGDLDLTQFLGLPDDGAGAVRANVRLDIDTNEDTIAELHRRERPEPG